MTKRLLLLFFQYLFIYNLCASGMSFLFIFFAIITNFMFYLFLHDFYYMCKCVIDDRYFRRTLYDSTYNSIDLKTGFILPCETTKKTKTKKKYELYLALSAD